MLTCETEIPVKFSEVDSLTIAWHGHYIRYFEDAREAFGEKYDLRYLDVYAQGYVIPMVRVECDYKRPLRYGDTVRAHIELVATEAAKLIFRYQLFRKSDNELVAVGESIQVFLSKEGDMMLTVPDFFVEWKTKHFPAK
jgi:acyl-CoA thioester hydrolase